jgi:hypothetical protein
MKKLTELVQNQDLLVVLSEDQMENVKGGNNLECWYI